jgi:hypothetical protein
MKRRVLSIGGCLLAGLLSLPAWAQQRQPEAPHDASYREPLAAATQQATVPSPSMARTSLPVFAVQPASGERFSREALTFASRAAVQVASEKTGVSTPLPSPTYQPYRPGVSVPEPATQERSCPPLGTPSPSAACVER